MTCSVSIYTAETVLISAAGYRLNRQQNLSLEQREIAALRIREDFAGKRLELEKQTALAEIDIQFAGLPAEKLAAAKLKAEETFRLKQLKLARDTAAQIDEIQRRSANEFSRVATEAFRVVEAGWDQLLSTLANNPNAKVMVEVWGAVKTAAIKSIGDILKAELAAQATGTAAHTTAESTKSAVTAASVAKRIGLIAFGLSKEIAMTLKSIGLFLGQAAAKLAAWFASLGPIGFLAGVASIPTMIAGAKAIIKKVAAFKDGAIAQSPTLALFAEAGDPEAAIPLNQRGADFIASFLPKILIERGGDDRMNALLSQIADGIKRPAPTIDLTPILDRIGEIAEATRQMPIVLEGALEGQTFLRKEMPLFNKIESARTSG